MTTSDHEANSARQIAVSIIVTAKNEEESIPVLAGEIEAALDGTRKSWECIWIDDGSTDTTLACMSALNTRRAEHRFISFDRNYGQSAAMAIGFRTARGAVLVTLDADLQNDPQDIPRLLAAIDAGDADMANGVRVDRHDTFVRRYSSRIANAFRNWMTRESVTDVGCSLRALRAECVRDLIVFNGVHRFLPTMVRLEGYRIVEIPVGHRPRRFGRAKYGINNRLWRGLRDTFGVRWLEDRYVRPRVRSCSPLLRGESCWPHGHELNAPEQARDAKEVSKC